jgi:uncharacterized protein YbjQ (UPF0145 family)
MGFWKKTKDEQERAELVAQARAAEVSRQEIDFVELERGGIPLKAQERLKELGSSANSADYLFTSDLAPDELALLRRNGYKARGLVTGSAMYHVGQLYVSAGGDCEIDNLSDAYNNATALAVGRMQKELELINAHGVLGVRINIARHEWAEKTIEVQIIGTAIETPPGETPARPWLSDLSGQEWFALKRAGYEPVGLVWGHCAWWLYTSYTDDLLETSWSNVEMTHWSEGLTRARNIAMHKVQASAKAVGGNGVVGVNIERRVDRIRHVNGGAASERMHHNLLLSIVGTAVKASGREAKMVQQTIPVISLLDGRLKPMVVKQQRDFKVED